jgi:hypothetical protein
MKRKKSREYFVILKIFASNFLEIAKEIFENFRENRKAPKPVEPG